MYTRLVVKAPAKSENHCVNLLYMYIFAQFELICNADIDYTIFKYSVMGVKDLTKETKLRHTFVPLRKGKH